MIGLVVFGVYLALVIAAAWRDCKPSTDESDSRDTGKRGWWDELNRPMYDVVLRGGLWWIVDAEGCALDDEEPHGTSEAARNRAQEIEREDRVW